MEQYWSHSEWRHWNLPTWKLISMSMKNTNLIVIGARPILKIIIIFLDDSLTLQSFENSQYKALHTWTWVFHWKISLKFPLGVTC